MENGIEWVIGAGFTLCIVIGGIIARDRQVAASIRAAETRADEKIDRIEDRANTKMTEMEARTDNKIGELHTRLNSVKDTYVRRSDLDGHISRMENGINSLAKDMRDHAKETTSRLDRIIDNFTMKNEKDN